MKFLLTGLTSLALCSGTHVLGMTLQTDLLDGVDGGSITKGAVTASLKHRHEEGKSRLSNQIKSSTAVVTVKVNGKVVGTLVGPTKGGQPFSLMQVVELDRSNPYPEVILSAFSGGAHCCNRTTVLTSDSKGENWKQVVLAKWLDGTHKPAVSGRRGNQSIYHFENWDNRFYYKFASYAGSVAPQRFWLLKGDSFVDISKEEQFTWRFKSFARRMDNQWKKMEKASERNGYLAGYVAVKARIEEFPDGWKRMLESYDPESDLGLKNCPIGTPNNVCSDEKKVVYESFPKALQAFLFNTGYIDKRSDWVFKKYGFTRTKNDGDN